MVIRLGHTTAPSARRTIDMIRALSTGDLLLVRRRWRAPATPASTTTTPRPGSSRKKTDRFGRRQGPRRQRTRRGDDGRRREGRSRPAVVAAGVAYLLVLGWAMQALSYDIWGALVVAPVLALISIPLINRAFTDDLAPLRPWVWAGLVVKFAGAVVGYNVRFDAYGGSADAGRYHDVGKTDRRPVPRRSAIADHRAHPERHRHRVRREAHRPRLHRVRVEPPRRVHRVHLDELLGPRLLREGRSPRHRRLRHPPVRDRRVLLPEPRLLGLEHRQGSLRRALPRESCAYGASLVLTRRGGVVRGFVLVAVGLIGSAYVRPHFAAIWAGAIVIALVARVALDADAPLRPRHRRTPPQPGRHDPAAGRGRPRLPRRRQHHAQLPRPRRRRRQGDHRRGGRHRPALQHLRQGREPAPPRAARRSTRSPSTARRTGPTPRSAPSPGRCSSRPVGSLRRSPRSR